MRTLVIDSATAACSVALFDGRDLLAGEYQLLGRGHAEHLVPMISRLPDKGFAERIAVGLGPGSFTGIRVGLAAAHALGFAWNARLTGYPTLELVAAMARALKGNQPVCVAMTGGHGEWFVQGISADGKPDRSLLSLRPAEAVAMVHESLVAGSEAEALVSARGIGEAISLLPDARQFALLPEGRTTDEVRPIYGRQPDASPAKVKQ